MTDEKPTVRVMPRSYTCAKRFEHRPWPLFYKVYNSHLKCDPLYP